MGQYYILMNLDRGEYYKTRLVKEIEWLGSPELPVIPYLLHQSDQGCGGGDLICGDSCRKKCPDRYNKCSLYKREVDGFMPTRDLETKYHGRWAMDRIVLIGDGDSSGLWEAVLEGDGRKDISKEALDELDVVLKANGCPVDVKSEDRLMAPDMIVSIPIDRDK